MIKVSIFDGAEQPISFIADNSNLKEWIESISQSIPEGLVLLTKEKDTDT